MLNLPESRIYKVFILYFSREFSKSYDSFKNYLLIVEADLQSKTLLHLRDIKGLSTISEFNFKEDSTLVLFYELKMEEIPVGKEMKIKM
jgi:hypothetical protein